MFFIAASYSSNSSIVRALTALGMGLNGLSVCGYYVNHLDIAPPLASVLLGVTDTIATVAGIVSLILTGAIVQNHVSTVNWLTNVQFRCLLYIWGFDNTHDPRHDNQITWATSRCKGKVCIRAKRLIRPEPISSVSSMKCLGEYLLPPG